MENLAWVLYFADISGNVSSMSGILGVFCLLMALVIIAVNIGYRNSEDKNRKQEKDLYRIGIFGLKVSLLLIVIAVFIPTKQGLYAITVANTLEPEHLTMFLDKISDLKDVAKSDLIEIIKEVKK